MVFWGVVIPFISLFEFPFCWSEIKFDLIISQMSLNQFMFLFSVGVYLWSVVIQHVLLFQKGEFPGGVFQKQQKKTGCVVKGSLREDYLLKGVFMVILHWSSTYPDFMCHSRCTEKDFTSDCHPAFNRGLWGLWLWPTRYKLVPYMRLGWLCQTRFKLTTCLLEKKRKKTEI